MVFALAGILGTMHGTRLVSKHVVATCSVSLAVSRGVCVADVAVAGWGVFQAGGWVFLWVLFVAIPSVFFGQLGAAFLVRARPSVRRDRAVSWADTAGFAVWHVLVILVGCYVETWFPLALGLAILAALGLFWVLFRQLRREAAAIMSDGSRDAGFRSSRGFAQPGEVLIVTDAPTEHDPPHASR